MQTIIREAAIHYHGPERTIDERMDSPQKVANYFRARVEDDAREHFAAIYLDARHKPIADAILSIGSATASLVHPAAIYQLAVGLGAQALIVGHSHPSGDPTPSGEDVVVTKRLAVAGGIIGIKLLDSIVWTRHDTYYSMRESAPENLDVSIEGYTA